MSTPGTPGPDTTGPDTTGPDMTGPDVRELVRSAIADIAPDVDPSESDADLHDDLGLDSMDLLNLTAVVVQRSGVEIPERDLAGLRTIRQLEAYLDARLR